MINVYVTKKCGSSLAKDGNWTQRPQMVLTDTLNSASQAESPCIVSALAMRWEGRAGGGDKQNWMRVYQKLKSDTKGAEQAAVWH